MAAAGPGEAADLAVASRAAGDRAVGAGAGLKSFGYEREPS